MANIPNTPPPRHAKKLMFKAPLLAEGLAFSEYVAPSALRLPRVSKGERHSLSPFENQSPLLGGGKTVSESAPLRGLSSDSRDQKGERRSREPFYRKFPLLGGGRGRECHHA